MNFNSIIMEIWVPLVVAALIQASFSLGISIFTLLSGHTIAKADRRKKLGTISSSFILGFVLVIIAILTSLIWLIQHLGWIDEQVIWSVLSIVSIIMGFVVLLFYYRKDRKGTRLWLPRAQAEFIYNRTKSAKSAGEGFLLGGMAVLLEIVFIIFPMTIAAYIASSMTGPAYYLALIVYTVIAVAPQIALAIAYARGYKVGAIQRWREQNKRFLQITAGVLMITLSIYLLTYMA